MPRVVARQGDERPFRELVTRARAGGVASGNGWSPTSRPPRSTGTPPWCVRTGPPPV